MSRHDGRESPRTHRAATERATRYRSPRCLEGFLKGLCPLPCCPHFDGFDPNVDRHYRTHCESCAGPMARGTKCLYGRICSDCFHGMEAERKRRNSQEAWNSVPKRWLP